MLNILEAENKLLAERTEVASVVAGVDYVNVFLFRVKFREFDEADYDPFFSVNKTDGAVKEFSFLEDGDPYEVTMLFLAAEPGA